MSNEPRFEVYKRVGNPVEYGWRFRAGNAQITAVGGEGFTREEDAERAIEDFCRALLVEGALEYDETEEGPSTAAVILRVED